MPGKVNRGRIGVYSAGYVPMLSVRNYLMWNLRRPYTGQWKVV